MRSEYPAHPQQSLVVGDLPEILRRLQTEPELLQQIRQRPWLLELVAQQLGYGDQRQIRPNGVFDGGFGGV